MSAAVQSLSRVLVLIAVLAVWSPAQEIADMSVATISDGLRTELITYSDLRWQLALQPGVVLNPVRSEDLNRALELLVNQRIFALEAERIPRATPSKIEVDEEIKRVLAAFPSTAEFENRLRAVGFGSVLDENFQKMMAKRVAIEKFVDFRFRSFIVNTPEEEARYYNDVYAPAFRKKYRGLTMPTLEEKREEIDSLLTESKVLESIEAFLDETKRRVQVVVLKPV